MIVLSVLLRFTNSDYPFGIFDMQNPTQYLALFNLQKYKQNNLQILNNVNIFKANGFLHRTYVTLTDLALLLIFIGIIIIKNYVIIYCFTETKEESPDYIGNLNIPIITGVLLFGILSFGIVCLARYRQLQKGRLFRGKDQRSLKRHAKESPSQLTIAHKLVPTHDI